MNLLEVHELIKKHSPDQLRSVSIVEDLICQAGLHNDHRISDHYGVSNKYLVNQGMLQQPRQFAEALVYLSDKNIKTYIEIGTFCGLGTVFVSSYLNKFSTIHTTTVDNLRTIDPGTLIILRNEGVNISQVFGTSNDMKGIKSDLCFIDGDHNYDWVVRDYENVGKSAKIVMFHDIIDEWLETAQSDGGSKKHWGELMREHPDHKFSEFTYHPEGKKYFGIGIMEVK